MMDRNGDAENNGPQSQSWRTVGRHVSRLSRVIDDDGGGGGGESTLQADGGVSYHIHLDGVLPSTCGARCRRNEGG